MRARWLLLFGVVVVVAGVVGGNAVGRARITSVQWDIVRTNLARGVVNPGGSASARAANSARIRLTGSGTFVPGEPQNVTGGGTFTRFDPEGNEIRSARRRYVVKSLLYFRPAPGRLPRSLTDNVGNRRNASAGLAFLRVRFSTGRPGIIVVSSHLAGTPDSVFDGITAATKFTDYFRARAPMNGRHRTLFHVRRG
jgi:hypothetical protein